MLLSGFFEHTENIDPADVAVISYGVPRSGTTWAYQILRDLYPDGGVMKTHSYLGLPESVPAMVTYRDFRDVAISYWRVCRPEQSGPLTEEEIVRLAGIVHLWVVHFERYLERPNRVVLRYEDFTKRPADIFPELEQVLGRTIDADTRRILLEAHSLEINRGLRVFTDIPDPTWGRHNHVAPLPGGHCHEGQVGTWQRFVDEAGAVLLTDLLMGPLSRHGYV